MTEGETTTAHEGDVVATFERVPNGAAMIRNYRITLDDKGVLGRGKRFEKMQRPHLTRQIIGLPNAERFQQLMQRISQLATAQSAEAPQISLVSKVTPLERARQLMLAVQPLVGARIGA